jgi:hypothetical protein
MLTDRSETSRWRPSFRLSLKGLLLLITVIFIVGYQQHQLHRLTSEMAKLRDDHEALKRDHQSQQAIGTIRLGNAASGTGTFRVNRVLSDPRAYRVNLVPKEPPGALRFPENVERAMLGEGYQKPAPETAQR